MKHDYVFRTHGISSTDIPKKENDAFCLQQFDTSDASLISISLLHPTIIHSENTQNLNVILWLMLHSPFTTNEDSYWYLSLCLSFEANMVYSLHTVNRNGLGYVYIPSQSI